MNRIKVNGTDYPCPLDFTMAKTENIVSEITLMNGNIQGDVNGWRYDDVTLKWNWIEDTKLKQLLSDTSTATFNFTFKEVDSGTEKTIEAKRRSVKCTESSSLDPSGNLVWLGIEMVLSFPTCYHD